MRVPARMAVALSLVVAVLPQAGMASAMAEDQTARPASNPDGNPNANSNADLEVDPVAEQEPIFGTGFSLRLGGAAWMPRFDGDVRLGSMWLDLRDDLDHGGTRVAPWGEIDLRKDIWDLRLSGYTISEDVSSSASRAFTFGSASADVGDTVTSDLQVDSVAFELGVALYRPYAARRWPWSDERELSRDEVLDAGRIDLRVGAIGGVRWIGIDHDVRVRDGAGVELGRDGIDNGWLALSGGASLEMAVRTRHLIGFIDHIVIAGAGSAGGVVSGGGGTLWEVRAGIDLMFTPNFGLMLGYRLQELDFRDGDYDFEGGLQGMLVGGAIRF